jgi:hypothetical protein
MKIIPTVLDLAKTEEHFKNIGNGKVGHPNIRGQANLFFKGRRNRANPLRAKKIRSVTPIYHSGGGGPDVKLITTTAQKVDQAKAALKRARTDPGLVTSGDDIVIPSIKRIKKAASSKKKQSRKQSGKGSKTSKTKRQNKSSFKKTKKTKLIDQFSGV